MYFYIWQATSKKVLNNALQECRKRMITPRRGWKQVNQASVDKVAR